MLSHQIWPNPCHFQSGSTLRSTKVALLNIQSLTKKSLSIIDLTTTYNLEFVLLTETWLDNSDSASFLNESALLSQRFQILI